MDLSPNDDLHFVLSFSYRNWKGEISNRRVRFLSLWKGSTRYHPEEQWFLKGIDLIKNAERDFAVRDILVVYTGEFREDCDAN